MLTMWLEEGPGLGDHFLFYYMMIAGQSIVKICSLAISSV